jgi:hypothetical protein
MSGIEEQAVQLLDQVVLPPSELENNLEKNSTITPDPIQNFKVAHLNSMATTLTNALASVGAKKSQNSFYNMIATNLEKANLGLKGILPANKGLAIQITGAILGMFLLFNLGFYILHCVVFSYLLYLSIRQNSKKTSNTSNLTANDIISYWTAYGCFVITEQIADIIAAFMPYSWVYYLGKIVLVAWLLSDADNVLYFGNPYTNIYTANNHIVDKYVAQLEEQVHYSIVHVHTMIHDGLKYSSELTNTVKAFFSGVDKTVVIGVNRDKQL